MRLSAFSVADSYADRPEDDGRLPELVRLAPVLEESGFGTLWVAEHHFGRTGACPAPPVLLAACGAVTRSLRLGSLVSVLPFHRPIDVAEEYATLDRLLGGRLNFGVGSGYLASEFDGFGVDAATKRERFDSALDLVLRAWSGAPVRAGPDSAPVTLNVLPVQRPHPPVWVAVQRREAIPHVARRGYGVALIPYATVSGIEELAAEIREYRAHLPASVPGAVAVAVHLYAGDRPDLARAALDRYLASRLAGHSTFLHAKAGRDPTSVTGAAVERQGFAAIGTPESVRDQLDRFRAIGVDELLGIVDFGGLGPAETERSVRALGAIPRGAAPGVRAGRANGI